MSGSDCRRDTLRLGKHEKVLRVLAYPRGSSSWPVNFVISHTSQGVSPRVWGPALAPGRSGVAKSESEKEGEYTPTLMCCVRQECEVGFTAKHMSKRDISSTDYF